MNQCINKCGGSTEGRFCKACAKIYEILFPAYTKRIEKHIEQEQYYKEYSKEYNQRPDIKEKLNKQRKERYNTDKEYRERLNAASKKWRKANPEKVANHIRKYYLKNKDKILAQHKLRKKI